MSIDGTGNPGHDDETPAGTGDNGDRSAEQAGGQEASTNDDRGHRRAETLTREQYADAMRADGPPIQPDSSDSRQSPDGTRSGGRADTEEADHANERHALGPDDRGGSGDHAASLEDEPDRTGSAVAEPLTREEYADAMRGNGLDDGNHERSTDPDTEPARDASAATVAVTHFHSEFKDRPLDLYTDGTRWAAADTPRAQDAVSEKGDMPDRLPTGEELVDDAGESSSRLDRLRRDVYEESEDETDVLDKEANTFHDVFAHPPTSSYEGTPAQPHIYAIQHSGIDAGSMATALFTLGLVIDRAVHWAVGYYDKHAKGDDHAGNR